ncbi:Arc family DNA-binding protein [Paenibacillus sp. YPG26]|nr:Arc family DNA-binding protein [Paenibacillus sp. YPG26]USB31739.1 Arc family DNA-binding protein [Paenibacillus sp. YPG26]
MARKNFPLRLDPKVYEALEKWAQDELRSVNAQIEVILREALKQKGRDK